MDFKPLTDFEKAKEYFNEEIREKGFVKLRECMKLSDVARIFNKNPKTLNNHLKFLEEGVEYIKLGARQPVIISPKGVEKLINLKEEKL